MKTGYKKLDELLGGGLKRGEVTILAGRPGMHKHEFALNIAVGLANEQNKTMIFSNHYSEKLIKEKINKICECDCFDSSILKGLRDLFVINDSSYLTPKYIEKQIDNLFKKSSNSISTIFIDCFNYILCDDWNELQKNSIDSEKTNRNIVMNELRRIARDKNIAIILCVNLDKEIDEREDHRPNVEDLIRIINTECFPDNVIYMFRNIYKDCDEYDPNIVEANVSFTRDVSSGKIKYKYDSKTFKLKEEQSCRIIK